MSNSDGRRPATLLPQKYYADAVNAQSLVQWTLAEQIPIQDQNTCLSSRYYRTTWVGWYQNVKPSCILLHRDDGGRRVDNGTVLRCAKLRTSLSHKHQHTTSISLLYRPDAIPVTQPTVSKHKRHNSNLKPKVNVLSQYTNLPILQLSSNQNPSTPHWDILLT